MLRPTFPQTGKVYVIHDPTYGEDGGIGKILEALENSRPNTYRVNLGVDLGFRSFECLPYFGVFKIPEDIREVSKGKWRMFNLINTLMYKREMASTGRGNSTVYLIEGPDEYLGDDFLKHIVPTIKDLMGSQDIAIITTFRRIQQDVYTPGEFVGLCQLPGLTAFNVGESGDPRGFHAT